MKYLLDTHALLWWLFDDPQLSTRASGVIAEPENEILVSAASADSFNMKGVCTMNILGQIGNTPLLRLRRVNETPDVDIYVKCEFLNPGGSIKDRMALKMIEAAEESGKLKLGGTIVDQSTGNTGPALSFVGTVKGYDVQLFLPFQLDSAYNPADRIRIARLFGCNVTSIDLKEHMANIDELNAVDKAAAFVAIRMKQCYDLQERDPSNWWANQLCNVDNTKAHREHTGTEILEQMNGKVDAWVASIFYNIDRYCVRHIFINRGC